MIKRPSPLNTKDQIERNIDQATSYSPEFKLKKNNNYDNTIANASRKVLEDHQLQKYYHRKPAFSSSRNAKQPSSYINLGHSSGSGGRAFLYSSVKKADYLRDVPSDEERAPVGDGSKIHHRNK